MSQADRLAAAIEDIVGEFLAETGWAGEMDDLARWWVAPPSWQELEALGGIWRARFVFALTAGTAAPGDGVIGALTGAGAAQAILLWQREEAGSALRFAKFVGRQREMQAGLETLGFERNRHLGASFHLPLWIDAGGLGRARTPEDCRKLVGSVAAALRAAYAAAPLFQPLINWIERELDAPKMPLPGPISPQSGEALEEP